MNLSDEKPIVSILIPTFNQVEKLKVTISKIVNQTFPKEKIEILIFSDGNREEIVDQIKRILGPIKNLGFYRVELIENKENVGISTARNFLANSSFKDVEYLLFLDDDVYLQNNTIEILINCILVDNYLIKDLKKLLVYILIYLLPLVVLINPIYFFTWKLMWKKQINKSLKTDWKKSTLSLLKFSKNDLKNGKLNLKFII
jgi:glycosyltransferase involved in cell wall biosynthesis